MNGKNSSLPIYQQIIEKFGYDIASGKLIPGEKLKSIRDLAIEYKVNPNTMARALTELESMDLIYTDRTNGKYVVDKKKVLEQSKHTIMKRDAQNYIKEAKTLNLTKQETLDLINELWEVEDE